MPIATNQDDMFQSVKDMNSKIDKISYNLHCSEIAEYVQLMNSPRKLIFKNVLAGVSRGVGIAIGFTFFLATLMYVLRTLGALNLPIIGDYIADIVKVVQAQLDNRAY